MIDSLPLSPKQIQSIVESKQARISCWTGAVRSGKTIASLLAFLMAVAEAPDSGLVLCVGRTLQTIERNILDPLQDRTIFGTVADHVHHTRGATTAVILGRTVHLIGASDARAEGRIRGATVYLAYVDEATLVPESFWNQLLARLSVPGARLLATTNPDSPAHWLRKKFILRAAELDLATWHFTLDDNPGLDPAYVANLKAEYVGLWYKRFIQGLWVMADGAIFDAFDETRHVVPTLPAIRRYLAAGIDYGTTNPTHAVMLGLGDDNRLYVTSEWRYDSRIQLGSLSPVEYSKRIRAWLAKQPEQPTWVVVDPAARDFREQLRADGRPTRPGNNSVIEGIRTMSSLFATDKLKIHASCTHLLDEIPGYTWDPDKALLGEDAPIKLDDHGIDASRYAIFTTRRLWRPYVLAA
ncbi:PBSX family phage terminase large subunit [Glycomyces arizonensis]|uniref:PBSX family phage terminase large subunit n=1 Tax=Glycomyces arizonensis TaxID=256035 RepID=UPI00040FDE2F|nr:PBSX family phage terminase large subunit [Glycomyces arizonensis]